MICPCGAKWHPLESHPERVLSGWHPVFGYYRIDDTIFEHAQGEHDDHPDPECCLACVPGARRERMCEHCTYTAVDHADLVEHSHLNH